MICLPRRNRVETDRLGCCVNDSCRDLHGRSDKKAGASTGLKKEIVVVWRGVLSPRLCLSKYRFYRYSSIASSSTRAVESAKLRRTMISQASLASSSGRSSTLARK